MINTKKEAKELLEDRNELDFQELQDSISEIADGCVDIPNPDLVEWAGEWENKEYCDRALEQFGFEGCGESLMGIYKTGQYLKATELLNYALEDLREEREEE